MQRGDLVQCIYPGPYPLTLGRVYEVLDIKDGWITLMDDVEIKSRFAAVRFVKVEDGPARADRAVA